MLGWTCIIFFRAKKGQISTSVLIFCLHQQVSNPRQNQQLKAAITLWNLKFYLSPIGSSLCRIIPFNIISVTIGCQCKCPYNRTNRIWPKFHIEISTIVALYLCYYYHYYTSYNRMPVFLNKAPHCWEIILISVIRS